MYGISDKSCHDIDATFSRDKVRNDVTGKWRVSAISADVQMVEYATSVFESLSNITTASHAYIDNNHEGLDMEYIEDLRKMNNRVSSLYPRFRDMMETNDYSGLDECLDGIDALDEEFAEAVKRQIILRTENVSDMRRTLLYLNLLNETRTMIRKVLLLAKVQKKFVLGC